MSQQFCILGSTTGIRCINNRFHSICPPKTVSYVSQQNAPHGVQEAQAPFACHPCHHKCYRAKRSGRKNPAPAVWLPRHLPKALQTTSLCKTTGRLQDRCYLSPTVSIIASMLSTGASLQGYAASPHPADSRSAIASAFSPINF